MTRSLGLHMSSPGSSLEESSDCASHRESSSVSESPLTSALISPILSSSSAFHPINPLFANPDLFLVQQQLFALLSQQVSSPIASHTPLSNQEPLKSEPKIAATATATRLQSESPSSIASSPRKRIADIDKTSEEYLERRRKNNDSARRSREVRRLREQDNRARMQVLEQENLQLRNQIDALRMELSQVQLLLMTSSSVKTE